MYYIICCVFGEVMKNQIFVIIGKISIDLNKHIIYNRFMNILGGI